MNIMTYYMDRSKMNKYELSKRSGVPYATIHDLCSGKTSPDKCRAATIYKLSRALRVSCDDLIIPACAPGFDDSVYVTGTYALNLRSPDGTPGDWHFPSIDWKDCRTPKIDASPFGTYRIYIGEVPGRGQIFIADHIRACLDLIAGGYFSSAGGMRDNFIADEQYTGEIFDRVWSLRRRNNWTGIDRFMGKEYGCDWLDYKEGKYGSGKASGSH